LIDTFCRVCDLGDGAGHGAWLRVQLPASGQGSLWPPAGDV
jgi:hypothetical protein